jgi:hypothetical protein
LRHYRLFRTKKSFKHSKCGICRVNAACGGCRVFAADAIGGDPGCPDPVKPELSQTSGGFPLATAEQIGKWIGVDRDLEGYPEWIKKNTKINKENILVKPRNKKSKRR